MTDLINPTLNEIIKRVNDNVAQWGSITGSITTQDDLVEYITNSITTSLSTLPIFGGIEVRPNYSISTVDLQEGISDLTAGKLYFYYEENNDS